MVVASLHQPNDLTLLYNCRVGGNGSMCLRGFPAAPCTNASVVPYIPPFAVRTDRRRLILCAVCETESFAGKGRRKKPTYFSPVYYCTFGNLSVAYLGFFNRAVVLAIKKKNPFFATIGSFAPEQDTWRGGCLVRRDFLRMWRYYLFFPSTRKKLA